MNEETVFLLVLETGSYSDACQVGEGIREAIEAKREADRCEHGRPGGRLCAKCKADP